MKDAIEADALRTFWLTEERLGVYFMSGSAAPFLLSLTSLDTLVSVTALPIKIVYSVALVLGVGAFASAALHSFACMVMVQGIDMGRAAIFGQMPVDDEAFRRTNRKLNGFRVSMAVLTILQYVVFFLLVFLAIWWRT